MRKPQPGRIGLGLLLGLLFIPSCVEAQTPSSDEQAKVRPLPGAAGAQPKAEPHRFWDTTNQVLFAGVGVIRALDYASTRNLRARGRDEILLTNNVVDNKPLFAGIEAAGVAASLGVSYWLHRTGHHKLERWVSIAHISVGAFGAVRNYSLESRPKISPGP